jgi:hypothetical protein
VESVERKRRQVWRAVQPDRDVPSRSLPALRDADLIVTHKPATLLGDARHSGNFSRNIGNSLCD